MSGYRYFQLQEKAPWEVLPETPNLPKELTQRGAKRASILAVSSVVTEDTDPAKLSYRGPLYFDVDSGDLQQSITSTLHLRQKLLDLGCPLSAIEVHASGSKGFHIYVHEGVLGINRMIKRLPYIYREMAIDLYVPGLDFQPYCGGRGNLFRIPNVQREDGKYKIPLQHQELDQMTPDTYRTITSAPRTGTIGWAFSAPAQPVSGLLQLFELAKMREIKVHKEKQKTPLPDHQLQQFSANPPECVRALSEYKVRPNYNFNQAAFQMGVFIARGGLAGSRANSLIDMMAKYGSSSSYATERSRADHLHGLTAYLRHQPAKQFSCPAMRALLSEQVCTGCPLYDSRLVLEELYDIKEQPDGYYAEATRGGHITRLTNFIMVPRTVMIHQGEGLGPSKVRRNTLMTLERNHEVISEIFIQDADWNSRSAFVRAFTGIGDNLRITCTDSDVQRIKQFVLRDLENIDEQEVVASVGIHRQLVGSKSRYTYVEKDLSINKFGVKGTHTFQPALDVEGAALPSLKDVPRLETGDTRHEAAIRHLLQVNEPAAVASIFGWYMSCHLKAHVFGLTGQFPLLGIWGGRGSGKTQTASLFGYLHGCNFLQFSPPSLPAITPFAYLAHTACSNTVPRLFDEFNKAGMGMKKYQQFSETFKAAFNNLSAAKGTVEGEKLKLVYHRPTAPIVVLSEHQFEVPALRDRMYMTILKEPSLRPRTPHFEAAKKGREYIFQVAKECVLTALATREEWVEDRLNEWVPKMPDKLSERQRFGRAVILTGIDFAERVMVDSMKMDLSAELAAARRAYLDEVLYEDPSPTGVGVSEIDWLMSKTAEMMTMAAQEAVPVNVNRSNLQIDQPFLYVDTLTLFPLLKIYAAYTRDRMPLNSAGELRTLLSTEPYFAGEVMRPAMVVGRPVVKLSLPGMKEKGIDIAAFTS